MAGFGYEWNRGWRTVASAFVGVIFMTAVPIVTGVVMAPLMAEFGWSRAIITSNVFLCSIMTLLLAPVLGRLMIRFGPRRCALAAIIAASPALVLISLTGGSPLTWLAAWAVFAVFNVGISPIVWSGAVAALFDRARGMALAITLSGSGIAYFIFPPLAVALLNRFSWRGVYIGIAALLIVVLVPIVYAWFRGAEDLGVGGDHSDREGASAMRNGFTLQQALRMPQFWQFITVAALMALAEGALHVHFFPILREGGLSASEAAWVISLMGIAMIAGRVLTGVLQDRFPPVPVFGLSITLVLVSCILLRFFPGNALAATAVSVCLGAGSGGTTVGLAYLTSRYFGLHVYPSIYGLMMGAFSLGYGIAPVAAGYFREVTGSYFLIFDWLGAALLVAVIVTGFLGQSKVRAEL